MPRLSEMPWVHETAEVTNSTLGRYTEVQKHATLTEVALDDYSYIMGYGDVWCANIGKFANIASNVRINATNHPTWRATQHHFTYRAADYFEGADMDEDFFEWRRENQITIGHDVWIGHGSTILPGVSVGNGAVIGAGAVVSKDVPRYTVVGGVAAKPIKQRFPDRICDALETMAWWDWSHDQLHKSLTDFRKLPVEAFVEKYEASVT